MAELAAFARRAEHVRRRPADRLVGGNKCRELRELIAAIVAGKLVMPGRYLMQAEHVEVRELPRMSDDTIQVHTGRPRRVPTECSR